MVLIAGKAYVFQWLRRDARSVDSAEFAAAAAAAAAATAEDASELSTFTPAFLWLLRDFYLDLEDEGRKVRSNSSSNACSRSISFSSNTATPASTVPADLQLKWQPPEQQHPCKHNISTVVAGP
jgi:hypothetical protein